MAKQVDRVVVAVQDGFADWEPALALAELRRNGRETVIAGLTGPGEVVSMGGVRVRPDLALAEVGAPRGLVVFVGGDTWDDDKLAKIAVDTASAWLERGAWVAAICGATMPLARAGLFAGRRHTSNDKHWLLSVAPDYKGRESYVDEPAVTDGTLITGSGAGSVAFTAEILAAAGVFTPQKRETWRALYQTGRFPPGTDIAAFFAE